MHPSMKGYAAGFKAVTLNMVIELIVNRRGESAINDFVGKRCSDQSWAEVTSQAVGLVFDRSACAES